MCYIIIFEGIENWDRLIMYGCSVHTKMYAFGTHVILIRFSLILLQRCGITCRPTYN